MDFPSDSIVSIFTTNCFTLFMLNKHLHYATIIDLNYQSSRESIEGNTNMLHTRYQMIKDIFKRSKEKEAFYENEMFQ